MLRRFNRPQELRVAICGGGASAALLAQGIAAQAMERVRITIIDPRRELGAGLAYSTPISAHLLNVPAQRLSVGQGEVLNFVGWLNAKRPRSDRLWVGEDFAPRSEFGAYLFHVLDRVRQRDWVDLVHVQRRAKSIERHGVSWLVRTEGRTVGADIVVIATGNEPPQPIDTGPLSLPRGLMIDSPWDYGAIARIPRSAAVLVTGLGLSGVDVFLQLTQQGHVGPIFALSRHALMPKAHVERIGDKPWAFADLPNSMSEAVHVIRNEIGRDPSALAWQSAMENLRQGMQDIWAGFSEQEQRRFLRHVQRFWDVHRHRVAPEVGEQIARAKADHQLMPLKGRIAAVNGMATSKTARVSIATAGKSSDILVDHIINCTGPSPNPVRSGNLLIQNLLQAGQARPDCLGLGLDVDASSRVIAKDGRIQPDLFAIGPPTRGRLLEITAIPEIRQQAEQIAIEAIKVERRWA